MAFRTDMALEARELYGRTGDLSRLTGVTAQGKKLYGFSVTTVDILNESGAEALGKPVGRYSTLDMEPYLIRREGSFGDLCRALADCVQPMLVPQGLILTVGLGNEAMTPDAVGPQVLKKLCITRHLKGMMPGRFDDLRPVACIAPGVLGTTGIESAELVQSAAEHLRPTCVVAVDALASGSPSRLCNCVQITDTGIIPGSGVGNTRAAFTRDSLGVPVIAVGVPTVIDAAALLQEAAGETVSLSETVKGMLVTPREIDARVADAAKVIGYGLNLAFQAGFSLEDVALLVE